MELTEISIENVDCTQRVGGNVYYSPCPSRVVDFSGNNNILKTPKNILKALKKADLGTRPDLDYKRAISNLADKHKVDACHITVEKNIFSLFEVVLKSIRARSASVVMPCETVYKEICRLNGCDVFPYVLKERKNFKFDSDDFIGDISTKVDTVIISNPNNVTGRVASRSDIKNILDFCLAKGIYVIVDETYMDFVLDGHSAVDMIADYYNLIVIRSLPEYYNLSGVGAAYAVSCSEIIENIKGNQLPWQLDVYGAVLCENAYQSPKFDLKTQKWIFEGKKNFVRNIKMLNNIKVIHSDCHFLLLKLEDTSATTVYNRLLKSNILIRDASSFTGLDGSYIRVAVKDEKSNNLFLETVLKCLI